jgi:hypothetical protein
MRANVSITLLSVTDVFIFSSVSDTSVLSLKNLPFPFQLSGPGKGQLGMSAANNYRILNNNSVLFFFS